MMEMPRHREYRPDQKQIARWILVVTLFLLGAGIALAYLVHANLETAYEELVAAHSTQQDKNKELTRESEELSKAVAEAEARLKDLQESESISEQEKIRLETKVAKVETALEVVQRAYIAEQVKTKKLGQKGGELSKALAEAQAQADKLNQAERPLKEMEQVRAQLKALEEIQKASGQGKSEFKVAGTRLESMLQKLETAYYAEQAKIDQFTQERAEMIALIVRLRAEMVDLNYTLGVNYIKLGMNKHAIEAFQTALDLDPDHADSHFELARVYNALGNREMAMVQFQQYVHLRPYAKDVERVKGWLLRVESEVRAKKRQRIWPKDYSSGKSPY